MHWQDQLSADLIDWLLEPSSPGVRYLALRDILDLPTHDPQLLTARRAAHQEGPIASILSAMQPEGYWETPGPGYNPKYKSTVWSIITLAQLGASQEEDERIHIACDYLLGNALASGGQFSTSTAPSGTADCLQGNLCWALLELGCDDPRLEAAFEWMARTVTGEGLASSDDRQATLRYYGGKCGPNFACGANNRLPCAWGAVKVMLAFSRWPTARRTPLIEEAIQAGMRFLFSVDPATAAYPSGWNDKPSISWWKFGFPVFYVTDILQVVEVLVNLGYGKDQRLGNALTLIRNKQDAQGRWPMEYDLAGKTWVDYGTKKQPNKWVTLRCLRVLKEAGSA
jgi:hypothetical protein